MSLLTRPRRPAARPLHAPLLTADAFLALPEGEKADLVHGRIVRDMNPTFRHEDIVSFLLSLMRLFAEAKGLGKVLGSNSPLRVSERSVYLPDVVFVSNARLAGVLASGELAGGADVVVEVTSPSTRNADYTAKREGYERAGVSEYWVVDPERGAAHFYRLAEGDLYDEVTPAAGEAFASAALAGFRLDPAALLAESLPSAFELLSDLLG